VNRDSNTLNFVIYSICNRETYKHFFQHEDLGNSIVSNGKRPTHCHWLKIQKRSHEVTNNNKDVWCMESWEFNGGPRFLYLKLLKGISFTRPPI
jgi:hypothetical protein